MFIAGCERTTPVFFRFTDLNQVNQLYQGVIGEGITLIPFLYNNMANNNCYHHDLTYRNYLIRSGYS